MNLKKWGSLLTAIAMVGSMAASSLPVSAAETTPDVIFSGTFTGTHVSYEYNSTQKVITLTSDVDNTEVPALDYGTDKGVIGAIKYDISDKTGGATAVTNLNSLSKIVIADANIDDVANGAFLGLTSDAEVEIHCQSDMAADKDSLDFLINEAGTVYKWKKQIKAIQNYTIAVNNDITEEIYDILTTNYNSNLAITYKYVEATGDDAVVKNDIIYDANNKVWVSDTASATSGEDDMPTPTASTDVIWKQTKVGSSEDGDNAEYTKYVAAIDKYTIKTAITVSTTDFAAFENDDVIDMCTPNRAEIFTDATGDDADIKMTTPTNVTPTSNDANVQWVADSPATGDGAEIKLADANVIVTHEMEANTSLKNHKCKYGDKIDNTFAGHDFTAAGGAKIDTTAHTHTCACGKTDADYVTVQLNYEAIHTFNAATHVCTVCGSDNKYLHSQSANLTITADDKNTHSKKCGTGTCTYKTNKEAHNIVVNDTDADVLVSVNGGTETIAPHTHYCDVCGYHGEDIQNHKYLFVKKPVKASANAPYTIGLVTPGTGETALVCECGAVKAGHVHTFKGENGFHYCLCGETMASGGSDVHVYNKRIDATTGQEVYDANEGVYCDCGAVDTENHDAAAHGNVANVYIDTVNHKHICSCGEVISDTDPSVHVYNVVKNGKHLCVCGKEEPAVGNGHNYNTIVVQDTTTINGTSKVVGTITSTTGDNQGLICVISDGTEVCNAVNPAHQSHEWQDDGNHGHFCACGATSTTHNYVSGVCTICGDLENHKHVLDDNCDCTVAGCGQTDIHSFVKVAEGKHICERCGESSLVCVYDDFDTVKHEHKCSICGKVKTGADNLVHNYGAEGAAKCVCQDCGNVKHHNTSYSAGTHKCTDCNKNIDHEYDSVTDKCTLGGGCTAVKPGHVHAFDRNDAGNEKCRCDATIEHEFALVADNAQNHKCTHDKRNDAGVVTSSCTFTPASHSYGTSGFCACGAVNPATLSEARSLNPDSLISTHTTAYIVSLTKARNELLAYDITTNGSLFKTDETAVAAIKLVKNDAAQAEFAKLLADFNALNADANNNKAGGYLEVTVIGGIGGTVEKTKLGGTVGSKVTAVAIANDGYKFDGWYSDSAGNNKFADTANYEYTLQNGTSTIYAKFVENDKVAIIMPIGVKYKGTVTNTSWSTATTARETVKFNLGEKAYIMADTTALSGATFQSFKDQFGYAHVYNFDDDDNNTLDCYEFTVTGSDEFILNTYTVAGGHCYITFTTADGSKELAMGTTVDLSTKQSIAHIEPVAPLAIGRTFVGWKYKAANQADLDAAPFVRLKDITTSGTLVPYYEKQTGLKLTVKGGRFGLAAEAEQNKTGFTYDDVVTLTADKQNDAGKYFSGWYVGATMVSNKLTFKYAVKGSVTIEAKYEGDEELIPESVYTLSYTQNTVSGVRQVVLNGNWAMSNEAVTMIDTGYVFAFANISSDDLTVDAADGSNIRKKSTGLTGKTGVYAYSMNLTSATVKNAPVSAKFYVTYVDANGAQKTVYTDMVTVNP